MSILPFAGTEINQAGIVREFLSTRTGIINYAYNVSSLQGAVNADGSANSYGSQTVGTTFSFYNLGRKWRHWYTTGGWGQLKGGNTPTTSTPAGFTDVSTSYADDSYVAINIPFNFWIAGNVYTTAYVGSNGYITFGGGSTQFSGLGPASPAYDKIFLGPGDRNWTYVGKALQYGYGGVETNSTSLTIRVETNSSYSVNTTRGTADSVYEVTFINAQNCVDGTSFQGLAINTGNNWTNSGGNSGLSGIYSAGGTAYLTWTMQAQTSWSPYTYENPIRGNSWQSAQQGQYWYPWPYTNY